MTNGAAGEVIRPHIQGERGFGKLAAERGPIAAP
jgi:hypothetical protein